MKEFTIQIDIKTRVTLATLSVPLGTLLYWFKDFPNIRFFRRALISFLYKLVKLYSSCLCSCKAVNCSLKAVKERESLRGECEKEMM
jgi:hypothetical protein